MRSRDATQPRAGPRGLEAGHGRALLVPFGLLVVLWSAFACVKPTNFGGFDEWFLVDLTSRGIFAFPYANRPLNFVWTMPAALFLPHTLWGYFLLHTTYLCGSGLVLLALCRRLAPAERSFPAWSAAFLLAWVPLDLHRLNAINNLFYSGVAFGTLLSITLFLESSVRRSRLALALACVVGFVSARCYEGVLGLLLAGPPLLLAAIRSEVPPGRWKWLAAWEAVMGVATVLVLMPVLRPDPIGSYQISGLGIDPHPGRWSARLLDQLGFHLAPLFAPLATLHAPALAAALVGTGLVASGSLPRGAGDREARLRQLARLAGLGLVLACLGIGVLTLSRAIRGPERVQGFSGPGIALLLAALVSVPSALWPRRGALVTAGLACWVILAGTARTIALQAEWDRLGAFGLQSRVLCGILRAAPEVEPNTLIVLLDEAGAFPATFTFRHAIRYFYAGRALGHVVGGHELFYPARFGADAVEVEPWPRIRGPWSAPATRHTYAELVVVRADPAGEVSIVEQWADRLPRPPGSARYAPLRRIQTRSRANPRAALLGSCTGPIP
jgi:hypothetical protein